MQMRIKSILIAVTVSAMTMTACQPTPDNNVVAGKDSAVFESLLAETAQGGTENLLASSETMDDEAGNAPDQKIRDEFTIENGKITVKLDAEVRSLSGKKLSSV
jgi:ABC-type glycerol-3-phosphate transport system substrate-binding protein